MYRQTVVTFLLLLSGLLCTSCSRTIASNSVHTPPIQVPTQRSIAASQEYVTSRAARFGHRVEYSGKNFERVERILNRFTQALGVPQGMWPHFVIDAGGHANAAALNQNSIVVYAELLEQIENEETLAFVLAHEVAHLVLRHGDKNSSISTKLFAQGELGSLDFEMQADNMGAIIFGLAGYDPANAPRLLRRALRLFADAGENSSHPNKVERVKMLKKSLAPAIKLYQETYKDAAI